MEQEIPIGLRFSIIHRSFKKRVDELLKEKELTAVQLGVLSQLRRLEREGSEEIRQRDLELAAHMSHPTMTELLKRLERKELVELCPSAQDRRCKLIRSTDKAEALRAQLGEVDREVFDWLCRGMDEKQIETLLSAMDIMLENAAGCCCGKDVTAK